MVQSGDNNVCVKYSEKVYRLRKIETKGISFSCSGEVYHTTMKSLK